MPFCWWIFAFLLSSSLAIPGNYETFDILNNKRLPKEIKKITGMTKTFKCKLYCEEHPTCEAFAFSSFERVCLLYKLNLGEPIIISNSYRLYVRTKTEEEGYYRYEFYYIKLILKRKNFMEAQKTCKRMRGSLVAIRDENLNDLISVNIMTPAKVFSAYIGLTDEEKEGTWKYMDGGEQMYDGWSYDGQWFRRDKNCAIIKIDGTWHQYNCNELNYFFCQVPMY